MYLAVYPQIAAAFMAMIREHGRAHGSLLRDLFVRHGLGHHADVHTCERILDELLELGSIEVETREKPDPTLSQRVFLGLQFKRHPGWVPGTKEHYWYCPAGRQRTIGGLQ